MTLAYALCKVSPSYFQHNQREAEIALKSISNAGELSRVLAKHKLKAAAARLIGALSS